MYFSLHNSWYYLLSLNLEEFWIVLCKSLFIHTKRVIFWGTFRPFFFFQLKLKEILAKNENLYWNLSKLASLLVASIFKAFFKIKVLWFVSLPPLPFKTNKQTKKQNLPQPKQILLANQKTMSRQPFCFCCSYAQNLRGVTFMELL